MLREHLIKQEAWKRNIANVTNGTPNIHGPTTRSKTNLKIQHPIQKGQCGKMISTKADLAWNDLPLYIKTNDVTRSAMSQIKSLTYSF